MRDEEVHGEIFAVEVFVDQITDGLWLNVAVQIGVILKHKTRASTEIVRQLMIQLVNGWNIRHKKYL